MTTFSIICFLVSALSFGFYLGVVFERYRKIKEVEAQIITYLERSGFCALYACSPKQAFEAFKIYKKTLFDKKTQNRLWKRKDTSDVILFVKTYSDISFVSDGIERLISFLEKHKKST